MRLGTTLTLIVLVLIGSGYLLSEHRITVAELSEAEKRIAELETALAAKQAENSGLRQENLSLQQEVSTRQALVERCEARLSQANPLMAGWGGRLPDEISSDLLIGLWAGALLTGAIALLVLARRKTA